jgi:hypothetical protein
MSRYPSRGLLGPARLDQPAVVATWKQLRQARPDLADASAGLLYQFGVGLAFLATVRKDGGPRVHPMCPLLTDDEMYALLVPSPKRDDLLRDPRFALHSFPTEHNEDAAYLTGAAELVTNEREAAEALDRFSAERPGMTLVEDQCVFRFEIETCMVTRSKGHGDPAPRHEIWRADLRG